MHHIPTHAEILRQLRNHGKPCQDLVGQYLKTRDIALVEPILRGLVGYQAGQDLLSAESLQAGDILLKTDLAIDSLGLLELSLLLEDVFSVPINADQLLGVPNLSGLTAYILDELSKSRHSEELARIRPDVLREIRFASAREPCQ